MLRNSIPATILDVSRTGFRLRVRTSVRAGTRCDLKADLDGIQIAAQVVVTRCVAKGWEPDGKGGRAIVYEAGAVIANADDKGYRELAARLAGLGDVCLAGDARGMLTETDQESPTVMLPRLVRDVMSPSVFTIHDDATLEELGTLLLGRRIGGAAVVDGAGQLVGLVTAQQLLEHAGFEKEPTGSGVRRRRRTQMPVRDIMTSADGSTIQDELPVQQAIDVMVSRRMNRLVVMRGQEIVGLLDAVDLLEVATSRPALVFDEEIELLLPD
jgi:CBS domain-containing protein